MQAFKASKTPHPFLILEVVVFPQVRWASSLRCHQLVSAPSGAADSSQGCLANEIKQLLVGYSASISAEENHLTQRATQQHNQHKNRPTPHWTGDQTHPLTQSDPDPEQP